MATKQNVFHSKDTISKIIVRKHTECKENVLKILLEKIHIISLSSHQINFLLFNIILCHNNSFYHYQCDQLCS